MRIVRTQVTGPAGEEGGTAAYGAVGATKDIQVDALPYWLARGWKIDANDDGVADDVAAGGTYSLLQRPSSIPAGTALAKVYEPRRQTYNVTDTSMRLFRAALARQKDGGAAAKILCAGDSQTAGQNSGVPHETTAYPPRLRPLLPSRWGTVYEDVNFFNNLENGGVYPDTRYTLGAGWTRTNGYGFGNQALWFSPVGPGTATLDFGPVTCDTFDVYYLDNGFTGNWRYSIDGGALADSGASFNAGTATVRKISLSAGSTGSHTLHIAAPTAAKQAFLYGVGYRTSTNAGGIYVMKAGAPGSTTTDWATNVNPGGSLDMVNAAAISFDLAIIMLSTNDHTASVAASTVQTNLTTLVNACRAKNADVLLVNPPPKSTAGTTVAQSAYAAGMYAICDSLDVALFDMQARWPSFSVAEASPYLMLSGDHTHMTSKGYQDLATGLAAALDF